jgi:uncharacterized iron-regulated protein
LLRVLPHVRANSGVAIVEAIREPTRIRKPYWKGHSMHSTPTAAIDAARGTRNWARKLASFSRTAKHLLMLTAVLATASPMAAPAAHAETQWLSTHFRDHPLVGTIWTSDFKPMTPEQLETAVLEANFVLLGEIHNNADHHRLQAQMVETLVRAGRRPAVIWEMIPASMQADLNRHLQSGSKDAGKLGGVLQWTERGWPDWAIYQPIAEAALAANLPLLGGAIDRETSRAISKSDPSQANLLMELNLHQPVKPEIVEALGKVIEEGHCNMLPKAAVKPMLMVQRATDAHLAKIVAAATPKEGAVLIAGSGHVRKDWAVPTFIRQTLPDATIASIAFFEVDPERRSASDYAEAIAGLEKPYDFIYFTPKMDLVDHCAEMAEHMKKMKPKN